MRKPRHRRNQRRKRSRRNERTRSAPTNAAAVPAPLRPAPTEGYRAQRHNLPLPPPPLASFNVHGVRTLLQSFSKKTALPFASSSRALMRIPSPSPYPPPDMLPLLLLPHQWQTQTPPHSPHGRVPIPDLIGVHRTIPDSSNA